jgi:hypothetical protein
MSDATNSMAFGLTKISTPLTHPCSPSSKDPVRYSLNRPAIRSCRRSWLGKHSWSKRAALELWAEHVERCAGNIIIARPVVEARAAETAALSELKPAENRELEAA